MPGVRLTPEQASSTNTLLKEIEDRLKEMSNGNAQLLFISPAKNLHPPFLF
jgi:hypothetical protein